MSISELCRKMIEFSADNTHDICHFLKVYAYAKTIGELEGLDEKTQYTLEAAALVHDIACPLCRVKYGDTSGAHQELESEGVLRGFFADADMQPEILERIISLVSRHHTYTGVDGADMRILLEADYLVNADESHYTRAQIISAAEIVFETAAGKELLNTIYIDQEEKTNE